MHKHVLPPFAMLQLLSDVQKGKDIGKHQARLREQAHHLKLLHGNDRLTKCGELALDAFRVSYEHIYSLAVELIREIAQTDDDLESDDELLLHVKFRNCGLALGYAKAVGWLGQDDNERLFLTDAGAAALAADRKLWNQSTN